MMERKLNGGKRPKIVKARKSGWTQARRDAFLAALAETCNVAMACRMAKVTSGSVYRERQVNAAFRAGWAQAIAESYARLELMMLRRAMDGTVKEVRRADGTVETVTEYSDRVGLQLLKQHRDAAAGVQADEAEVEEDAGDSVSRLMRRIDGVRRRLGLPDDEGEEGEPELVPA